MSRNVLAQADFSSLGLDAARQDVESHFVSPYHDFTTVERPKSGNSIKLDSAFEADRIFQPVNFIPEEV